jgi:hypothetical protein
LILEFYLALEWDMLEPKLWKEYVPFVVLGTERIFNGRLKNGPGVWKSLKLSVYIEYSVRDKQD